MEDKIFWELMGAACRMGRFVAAVPNAAASANIVGRLEVGKDGGETVLQRKNRPSSHIHFRPSAVKEFAFTFVNPGSGAQPCVELRTREGAPALRLYYQGKKAARRFEEFMERAERHAGLITGTWAEPAAAENEEIFVAGERARDGAAAQPEAAAANVTKNDMTDAANETAGASAGGGDAPGEREGEARAAGAAEVVNAS